MKSVLTTSVLFFLTAFSGIAQQFPSEIWHQGEVRLVDETIREGAIKYDLDNNTLQVKINEKTETYDASRIISFRFVQANINAIRIFYSLPYTTQSGYRRPIFFEVIIEGKMTLLAREFEAVTSSANAGSITRRRFNDPFYNGYNTSRRYLSYKLYFATQDGRIIESSNKMKDIIGYFDADKAALKKFIKKERLKLDRLQDVAKLVQHYNIELS